MAGRESEAGAQARPLTPIVPALANGRQPAIPENVRPSRTRSPNVEISSRLIPRRVDSSARSTLNSSPSRSMSDTRENESNPISSRNDISGRNGRSAGACRAYSKTRPVIVASIDADVSFSPTLTYLVPPRAILWFHVRLDQGWRGTTGGYGRFRRSCERTHERRFRHLFYAFLIPDVDCATNELALFVLGRPRY